MKTQVIYTGFVLHHNKKTNSYNAQFQACRDRDFLSCELYFFNTIQSTKKEFAKKVREKNAELLTCIKNYLPEKNITKLLKTLY